MEKLIYRISLHGCDDSTHFHISLDDSEYELIKEMCEKSKEASEYGCMPTMGIEKNSTQS